MSLQPTPGCRFEDYLAAGREEREVRPEFIDGEVFARVGATENYAIIFRNLIGQLRCRLRYPNHRHLLRYRLAHSSLVLPSRIELGQ